MKRVLLFLLAVTILTSCSFGGRTIKLVNGKEEYKIVVPQEALPVETLAASELQRYIEQISGVEIAIVNDSVTASGVEISVGNTNRVDESQAGRNTLGKDGFNIYTEDGTLYIVGGTGRGVLYGVYSFLEKYLGCRRYAPDAEYIPDTAVIEIPALISERQVPAFAYRSLVCDSTADQVFIDQWKLSCCGDCEEGIQWDTLNGMTSVSMYPNLQLLGLDVQQYMKGQNEALFVQNNLTGEFGPLRAYLYAKLMWNPLTDVDSLITDFTNGYYGKGGVYVKQYIDSSRTDFEKAAAALDTKALSIQYWDSSNYLSRENVRAYENIFDQAEVAVADDSKLARRVKIARLPVTYAYLEQAKERPADDGGAFIEECGLRKSSPGYMRKAQNFAILSNAIGVKEIADNHTTPDEYLDMTMQFVDHSFVRDKSYRKPVTVLSGADYVGQGNESALTDGYYGSFQNRVGWLGFPATQFEVIVDLGEEQEITSIASHFLNSPAENIYFPVTVRYLVSKDNINYSKVGELRRNTQEKAVLAKEYLSDNLKVKGRYVKVQVSGPNPADIGGRGFTYIDEITIR